MTVRTQSEGRAPGNDESCALVTGAARGIGAAVAEALADAGWSVAVNFRADADGAQEVIERLQRRGTTALAVQADVADSGAVDAMFTRIEADLGPVLVLVNNAGVRHDRLVAGLPVEEWRRVLDVNLTGTFNATSRALGPMIRRRFGRIVNISTVSASHPLPGQAAYAASKAGVEALTRTAALEVARRGVTVNAIAPGLVATDFVPEMSDEWARAVPARRIASADEIAACVRFLASEPAGYINGAVLPVDGGLSAGIGTMGNGVRRASAAT